MTTRIEWADESWNPMTGCTPVSEGCEHCYALRMLARNLPRHSGPTPTFHPDRLDEPLHWRKPRRIFVCSMSDLFHEAFSDNEVGSVLEVARRCPQHVFMLLTKRPGRMREFFKYQWVDPLDGSPQSNLYLGVTAENQQRAEERIPMLLDTPAAVRFVSVEPMLGPVDLSNALHLSPDGEPVFYVPPREHVDWVILGGETGPGARPMFPDWALDVWRQCRKAGVPFFFKKDAAYVGERDWWFGPETDHPPNGEDDLDRVKAMRTTREFPRGAP